MCVDRIAEVKLLLPTRARERGKPEADGVDRQAIHANTILWEPSHGSMAPHTRIWGESKKSSTVDGIDGPTSVVSQKERNLWAGRKSSVSVLAGRFGSHPCKPSMGIGHHIHSGEIGVHVFSGHFGLAQPICGELGTLQ